VDSGDPTLGNAPAPFETGTTLQLVLRAREGDRGAREMLAARFLQPLKRFAHGRIPQASRGVLDTDDIVQETLIRVLNHVDHFEPRHPGAFLAYMRQAVLNQIRDEARRAKRRPARSEMPEDVRDAGPSPLEQVIGREALEIYERALARLRPEQREVVIMRIELGFSFAEMAEATGSPSANAVRMAATRAVARLAELMRETREQG